MGILGSLPGEFRLEFFATTGNLREVAHAVPPQTDKLFIDEFSGQRVIVYAPYLHGLFFFREVLPVLTSS